jgi:Kef-type K+ transport system membrane component KefB
VEIYFKFILTFALVLIVARLCGELTERYLKQPPVLGELIAGIIISPFALGGFFHDPVILNFATIHGAFGLKEFHVMEILSEIAVIALLFVAGVETDVKSFLKYGKTGAAVAFGGVILPFIFGFIATMLFFHETGVVGWLFMGAVLTATSIGVTVRILMDMGRLQTGEGTTILVGAVVDDIIGLVILSIVISIGAVAKSGEELKAGSIVFEAIKTGVIGFAVWFALLMFGVKCHKFISKFLLNPFKKSGTAPIFAIVIGYLISYLVTLVGLHPVVGAYVSGLMFAATTEKEEILENTRPIMLFLAPFFFAYLGMGVDLRLVWAGIIPAIILIVLATIGKIAGCYLPARLVGKLSNLESTIVGVGMVPRGEVGLIVAGAGFIAGAINRELFGAAVAVSIVTTLITPAMLKLLFKKQLAKPELAKSSGEK